MDNFTFESGKHKGKTYKDVRINHTEYFIYLITQPAGNVYAYFDFIKYCMEYIRAENMEKQPQTSSSSVSTYKNYSSSSSSRESSWPPSVNQR